MSQRARLLAAASLLVVDEATEAASFSCNARGHRVVLSELLSKFACERRVAVSGAYVHRRTVPSIVTRVGLSGCGLPQVVSSKASKALAASVCRMLAPATSPVLTLDDISRATSRTEWLELSHALQRSGAELHVRQQPWSLSHEQVWRGRWRWHDVLRSHACADGMRGQCIDRRRPASPPAAVEVCCTPVTPA